MATLPTQVRARVGTPYGRRLFSVTPGGDTDVADQTDRKPEQIEAEIVQARDSLADSLDEIENRLRPANLVQAAKDRVMGLVRRPDGSIDPRRAAAAAGVGLLLVTYLVRRRRI
jgi:Protein of unknown function (DUF3618)